VARNPVAQGESLLEAIAIRKMTDSEYCSDWSYIQAWSKEHTPNTAVILPLR
jgi:hypothetical protein